MRRGRHRAHRSWRGLLGAAVWRRPAFRRLWLSQSVSELGSSVTIVVLPLIAVTTLHATPWQVGLVLAAQTLPFLVVGLPAGAWVDRWSRRRVLILTDVLRALGLASIPLTAALGGLTVTQLVVVGLAIGAGKVFFDIAYQSYLPEVVDEADLEDGNAALSASQSVGEVAGPALGGVLVAVIAAPLALLVDAVSFAWSAAWIATIPERSEADPGPVPDGPSLRAQIAEGLRFVLREPRLRAVVTTTALANLSAAVATSVAVLFLARVLHLPSAEIGVLLAAGGVGGFVGAMAAGPLAARLGRGPSIWVPLVVVSPFALIAPFLTRATAPVYGVVEFLVVMGVVVYNIGQVSMRQRICPPGMLGRMNATVRFLVWGTIPLGTLIGGALAGAIGVRETLLVSAVGQCIAVIPVVLSPLRHRQVAEAPAVAVS